MHTPQRTCSHTSLMWGLVSPPHPHGSVVRFTPFFFKKKMDKNDISDKSDTHLRTSLLSIVVYQLPILVYLNDCLPSIALAKEGRLSSSGTPSGVYHEGETLLFRASWMSLLSLKSFYPCASRDSAQALRAHEQLVCSTTLAIGDEPVESESEANVSPVAQPPISYAADPSFEGLEEENRQNENFSFRRFLARFRAVFSPFACFCKFQITSYQSVFYLKNGPSSTRLQRHPCQKMMACAPL